MCLWQEGEELDMPVLSAMLCPELCARCSRQMQTRLYTSRPGSHCCKLKLSALCVVTDLKRLHYQLQDSTDCVTISLIESMATRL